MEIAQPPNLAEQLQSATSTPIAELDPELPDQPSKVVRGVVTITWPFNAVQNTFSFILAEPDFRLRLKRGQVRVNFSGTAAKELGIIGLSSTDEVTLSLDGVQWKSGTGSKRQGLPASNLECELNYSQRLVLLAKLGGAADVRLVAVDSSTSPQNDPAPQTTIPTQQIAETDSPQVTLASTPPEILSATPVKNPRVIELNENEFVSPAFSKRARESLGSLFEDGYDIFEDDGGVTGRGRKKLRFSGRDSNAWRYGGHSPSPEPEREPEPELEPEHSPGRPSDKQAAFGAEQHPEISAGDHMVEDSTQNTHAVASDLHPSQPTEDHPVKASGQSDHASKAPGPNSQTSGNAMAHETPIFSQSGWSSGIPLSMPISAPTVVSTEPHGLPNLESDLELGMANSEIQQEWVPEPSVYSEYPVPPDAAHPNHFGEPVGFYEDPFHAQQSFEPEATRRADGDMDLYPEGDAYGAAVVGTSAEDPQSNYIPYPQTSQAYPPLEEMDRTDSVDHNMVSLGNEHMSHAPGYTEPAGFHHGEPVPTAQSSLEPSDADAVNHPQQTDVPRSTRFGSASGDSAEEPLVIDDEGDLDDETDRSATAVKDGAAMRVLSKYRDAEVRDEVDAEFSDDEPEDNTDETGGDYDTRNYLRPNDDEDDSHDEDLRSHSLEPQFDDEDLSEDEDEMEDQADDQDMEGYDEDDIEDFESQGGYDDEENEDFDEEDEGEDEDEDDDEMQARPTARAPPSAPAFIDLISSSEDEGEDQDDVVPNSNEMLKPAENSPHAYQENTSPSRGSDEAKPEDKDDGVDDSRNAETPEDSGSDAEQSDSKSEVTDGQEIQEEVDIDKVNNNQQIPEMEPEVGSTEDSKPSSMEQSATNEHSTNHEDQETPTPTIDNNPKDTPECEVDVSHLVASSPEKPFKSMQQDMETSMQITMGEVTRLEQNQNMSTGDVQSQSIRQESQDDLEEVELIATGRAVEVQVTEQTVLQEKPQVAPSSPPMTQPHTSFVVEETVDISMPDAETEKKTRMSSEQLPTPFDTQRAESPESENLDPEHEHEDKNHDTHSSLPTQADEPIPKTPPVNQDPVSQAAQDENDEVLITKSDIQGQDESADNHASLRTKAGGALADVGPHDCLETAIKDQATDHTIETPDRMTRSGAQHYEEPSGLLSFRSQLETDDELQASILQDSIHEFEATPERSFQSPVVDSEIRPQNSSTKANLPFEGANATQETVSSPLSSITPASSRPRTRQGKRLSRGSLTPSKRPGSSGARSLAETESDSQQADASVWLARAANASRRPSSRGQTSPSLHRPHTRSRDYRRSSTPMMDGEDTSVRLARSSLGSALATSLNVEEESSSLVTAKLDLARRLRDELHDTSPLADLRTHMDRTIDAIGVAMMKPPNPRRAKSGPREYMMSFTMSDYSIGPNAVVEVLLYRRVKDSLPIIKAGDIVLLRKFKVVSIPNKDFGLQSGDESGWAVYDHGEDEPPQIRGPPVEVLDAETEYAKSLREWFSLLDEKQRVELERANKKMIEAGSRSSSSNNKPSK